MKKNKTKGKRITITLDGDVLPTFEDWRAKQRPIPKVTRAVNDLLRKALGLKKEPSPTKQKIESVSTSKGAEP